MDETIIQLIENVLNDTATEDDLKCLKMWIEESEDNREYFNKAKKLWHASHHYEISDDEFETARGHYVEYIQECKDEVKVALRKRIINWAVAASVVLTIGFFVGKGVFDRYYMEKPLAINQLKVAQPGPKAELILSNGEKVDISPDEKSLGDMLTGAVGDIVNSDTTLDFSAVKNAVDVTSTVKIPNGGYYKLTLSDGSTVILNSASELIFPVSFSKKQRKVYLRGEAYFNVAHDASRKFIVSTDGGVDVIVHGTSFNVNAYQPDRVVTTLVKGSVACKMASSGKTIMMKPNQTCVCDGDKSTQRIISADTYAYTAWKDGKFVFDSLPIEEIMKKLCVWYNINVEYDDEATKFITFTGVISRSADVYEILRKIESTTAVKFYTRGNTVIVK